MRSFGAAGATFCAQFRTVIISRIWISALKRRKNSAEAGFGITVATFTFIVFITGFSLICTEVTATIFRSVALILFFYALQCHFSTITDPLFVTPVLIFCSTVQI